MKKTPANINVTLLQTVPNIGVKGQTKKVKFGYFRNYLAPKGLAVFLTKSQRKAINKENQKQENKFVNNLANKKGLLTELNGTELEFVKKARETGTLYGSVSVDDIKTELEKSSGIEIPLSAFKEINTIKRTGKYQFKIEFENIEFSFIVEVLSEEEKSKKLQKEQKAKKQKSKSKSEPETKN